MSSRTRPGSVLSLALFVLAGCATSPDAGKSGAPANAPVIDCNGRAFHAALREHQATLYLPGVARSLSRTDADNGTRYAGNGYELLRRGKAAVFRTPERTWTDCRVHRNYNAWARAWLQGMRFRAVGHEPDWALEIGPGRRLHLRWQAGEKTLTTTLDEAELNGNLIRYRGRTDRHRVRIEILEHICRDNGKGEQHTHAVRLTVDDQRWHGCGRGLAPVEAAP